MNVPAQCKFCHRPITLIVADEYASQGDPFKLIPLAACNRCADLRVCKAGLDHALSNVCITFGFVRNPSEEQRRLVRLSLERLTKAYVRMVADWYAIPELQWDVAIVEDILNRPQHFGTALGFIWKGAREAQRLL